MSAVLSSDVEDKRIKLELRLAQLKKNEACEKYFLNFVKTMWPEFIGQAFHQSK